MKLKELSNFLKGQKIQKIIRLKETDLIQQQMEDKIQGSSNIPIIFKLLWLCKRREPPLSKSPRKEMEVKSTMVPFSEA